MDQSIILCGLGRIGWRLLEYLRAAGFRVVAIDTNCDPDDPRLGQVRLVKGDYRQQHILEEAGVLQARGVFVMANDDLVNISAALLIRNLRPDVRVVMRLFNQNLVARLGKTVSNIVVLSTADLTAPLFALTALTGQALGTIRIKEIEDDGRRQVAQADITDVSALRGQKLSAACDAHKMQVIAHYPSGAKPRFLRDVDPEAQLISGDRLIVCGDPHDLAPILDAGASALPHVRWAGWLRRMGRMIWRTLSEVELAVKVCTSVLVSVILISTIVFYFALTPKEEANRRWPIAYAFFRVISVMATSSDMHEAELAHRWLLPYAAGLRLSGAALLAAFTAIVTNYLLRARLGGALEIRRIPDSGHVVVCGLGNIGYRIIEELIHYDERVVVIEQSRDSRFVSTARRLGVPVLIGDATVAEVLRQAHVSQARAVIAATSDDLINLEVALMVRELNPSQRVVLHLSDPTLAETVRQTANIRMALSIPSLVAPAFLAALFGDRVHGVFVIGGRMFATVDFEIPAEEPFWTGDSVRGFAADYGMLPVAVLDGENNLIKDPLDARLEAGRRVIGISSLRDLERLLRREPPPQDHALDVTGFPISSRPWLAAFVQRSQGLTPQAADALLNKLPFRLGPNLTRGQAEEMLEQLRKQDITARLTKIP
jgi:Trk K+ transport system NAD-binding subunit